MWFLNNMNINNLKLKIFIIAGIALIAISIIVYVLFFVNKDNTSTSYPKSVEKAINNPIDKNENWNTLVDNDNFQISYSKVADSESFFITINAKPVNTVSLEAEQSLLQKLGIDKEYACTIPVVINVPSSVDEKLTGYNFGLSFCPNRIHVSDIASNQNIPTSNSLR